MPTNIAIFASGAGSNAQKIIDHFRNNEEVQIALIVCNNPLAGILQIAEREKINSLLIERQQFLKGDAYLPELEKAGIRFIVLAGFLWKLPQVLIEAFPQKIINIHPALLPKYGGKGMYGQKVHEAVINSGDAESGITIHYVDEHYDHGDTILQATTVVEKNDTPHSLAQKIHALEHKHYPLVIAELLQGMNQQPE